MNENDRYFWPGADSVHLGNENMKKSVEKSVENDVIICFMVTYDNLPSSNKSSLQEIVDRFKKYELLLKRWNKRNNIVSHRDVENLWKKHFVPSLKPLEINLIPENAVCLDAGSGGGFPGFPIALFRKDIRITMCDSNRRKTLFLRSAAPKLVLNNVSIVNRRIETIEEKFKFILSRGMGKAEAVIPLLASKLDDGGKIIIWTFKDASESYEGFNTVSHDIKDGGKLMVLSPVMQRL